jgi:hypothetical protein
LISAQGSTQNCFSLVLLSLSYNKATL